MVQRKKLGYTFEELDTQLGEILEEPEDIDSFGYSEKYQKKEPLRYNKHASIDEKREYLKQELQRSYNRGHFPNLPPRIFVAIYAPLSSEDNLIVKHLYQGWTEVETYE